MIPSAMAWAMPRLQCSSKASFDAPGQVVGVVNAGGFNLLSGFQQLPQDARGNVSGKLPQDILSYGKDGLVVDLQDVFPGR